MLVTPGFMSVCRLDPGVVVAEGRHQGRCVALAEPADAQANVSDAARLRSGQRGIRRVRQHVPQPLATRVQPDVVATVVPDDLLPTSQCDLNVRLHRASPTGWQPSRGA
jgi:hypothetical protein